MKLVGLEVKMNRPHLVLCYLGWKNYRFFIGEWMWKFSSSFQKDNFVLLKSIRPLKKFLIPNVTI